MFIKSPSRFEPNTITPFPAIGSGIAAGVWVSVGMGISVGIELDSWVGSEMAVGCSSVGTTGVFTVCSVVTIVGLAVEQATINNNKAMNGMVRLLMSNTILSFKYKVHGRLTAIIMTFYA
jgi:hypothetical protein